MGTHPDNRDSDPCIETDSDVSAGWYHPSSSLPITYDMGPL